MISLGLFRAPQWLSPQVGADLLTQVGNMFPVGGPHWLVLE